MKQDEAQESAALTALGLRAPLLRGAELGVDEWTIRRIWENVQRRVPRGPRRSTPQRRTWLKSSLALALGLLVAGWFAAGAPLRRTAFQGPLVTSEGKRFESVESPDSGSSVRVEFADGSQIEASPGARIEGLAATAGEFVLLLRRGRAHFSVTPGGPRRWLIEARGASVEVVGTMLSVESGSGFVTVRVEKGVVLVRSPLLADGVQRLGAGQALRLDTGPSSAGADLAGQAPAAARDSSGAEPPASADATEDAGPSDAKEPSDPAETEKPRASHARAQRRPGSSAAELWSGADRARRAGDDARAAELLGRLLEEHSGDSQAALGAYTLGVLQLERLDRPRAAARSFRRALELGVAAGLQESCYVRSAEALRQAGDDAAVRRVARAYLRRYPLGEQRDAMQKLLTRGAPPGSVFRSTGESLK